MKRKIILVLVVLLLVAMTAYFKFLLSMGSIGICDGSVLCESTWFRGIIWPFLDSYLYIIVSILFLICLPYSYLKIWMKIMIPYFVVALIILMATPALCDGMICWDRTLVASGFAKLFLILTIIIILIKAIYLYIASRQNK